jgi:hypothetical protein
VSLVATSIYLSIDEVKADGKVISESVVGTIVGVLGGSLVFFFACFLLLMKREYWGTFFSVQTGYAWVQSKFIEADGDERKSRIFVFNKKMWLSIRGDVKAWTLENWERWEDEQPEWFNDNFRAAVDDDMIPPASLRKLNGGSKRRRSSLGDLLGGGGASVAPVAGGGNAAQQ